MKKQSRMKSPNKCPMLKQNADGSARTGKRQFNAWERDEDNVVGPTRRWRAREKGRQKGIRITDPSDKGSPGKTQYHMELVREAAEVEKEVEQYNKGVHKRATRSSSGLIQATEIDETQKPQHESPITRPPFISSGTLGYKKTLTRPLMPQTSRPTSDNDWSKTALNEEKLSLIRSVRGNVKAQRGPDLAIVKENLEANVHATPSRDRPRLTTGTHVSGLSGNNKKGVETSRSWAHPPWPHSGLLNPQGLKTANEATWKIREEDQPNDNQGLGKDSAPQELGRDSGSPRTRGDDVRPRYEMWKGFAGSRSNELIFEIGTHREGNARKGDGSVRQEKRVQEPKLRQKAVWKSYIDEKQQADRKTLEALPISTRSIKSAPSSPHVRSQRVAISRPKRHPDQQDDYQSKSKWKQPLAHSNARNCHSAPARVKISPNPTSRVVSDKSVPHSWKFSQENSNGIEVEAAETIRPKLKSLSNRFQSPVTQVPRQTSPLRRSQKDLISKESRDFRTESSRRRENPQELEDTESSCEKEGIARKDAELKAVRNLAHTLINAWEAGKFQDDCVKAIKRAKEIISGSSSSGISHNTVDHNYTKPWLLSRSPFKRSIDQEKEALPHGQNQRIGSATPMSSNRSPMTRFQGETMSSPKRKTWTSRSLLGPGIRKSSPVKSSARLGKMETSKDAWEGQSLDFVLGSLAEQVRELDERLRSATVSSPSLSSSSSLSREFHAIRHKQTIDRPTFSVPDKISKDHDSPSSSSMPSSPERSYQEINRCTPTERIFARGYTNGNARDIKCPAYRASVGTSMDELKTLLREISMENSSPVRRNVIGSSVTRKLERERKSQMVQDITKTTEFLCSMNKSEARSPRAMAKIEAGFVSSSSISANASRACSEASQRVELVEKGRAPPVGDDMITSACAKGELDHGVMCHKFYGHGTTKVKDWVHEEKGIRETKTYERRKVSEDNGFRHDNGIRRVLEKRLVQRRWTQQQAAENGRGGVQERLEKRTVEVRGCAPHQVLHNGHAGAREQLVKEVVENGLPSPEVNGHGSFRNIAVMPDRHRNAQMYENGKDTPAPHKAETHAVSSGHKMTKDNLRSGSMQQMENQVRGYALLNGGEKLRRNRQPETPLWGEGSPHCAGSWSKGGMDLDEVEDRMLLSGSVDFSPWNSEKLPEIRTPKTQRSEPSRNGNKAIGPKLLRKDGVINGEYFSHPNPARVGQSSSQEGLPYSGSKSSQDDNYLPVIMAKDPESRQKVLERRRKALQLDMEHRQRLRTSRPSSARSSL